MKKKLSIRLLPTELENQEKIKNEIAVLLKCSPDIVYSFKKVRQSIDARGKQIWINIIYEVIWGDKITAEEEEKNNSPITTSYSSPILEHRKKVIIIGAGPAGLFAAWKLIEKGFLPIIIERGKKVRDRRRDIAILNKEGIINPHSNYCFGEGGAGTYSDGKLYTRSNKRGDMERIFSLMIKWGAPENIQYEARPHIGTNKLPMVVENMREAIIAAGGCFFFNEWVNKIEIKNNRIERIISNSGKEWEAPAVILATGHSAIDIYELLYKEGLQIIEKDFAMGVRIEHPQCLIDQMQYRLLPNQVREKYLPPAYYNFVTPVQKKRSVFSFCMCPGGIIAPAATDKGGVVVNGWSPSKRNNPLANSALVVNINRDIIRQYLSVHKEIEMCNRYLHTPLLSLYFQRWVEQKTFDYGGGLYKAPVQKMTDFCTKKISTNLPSCSYLPGITSVDLSEVLPYCIDIPLREGILALSKKKPLFYTQEALLVAVESRTSSPIRIPRNNDSFTHPECGNLFPCGEGAGYAGGIMSAAMDGEAVAEKVAHFLTCY